MSAAPPPEPVARTDAPAAPAISRRGGGPRRRAAIVWRGLRRGRVFFVALAVLVAVRLTLPFAVRAYVNRTLARLPDYAGTIGDVDVNLWRGAYAIDDLRLTKPDRETGSDEPFFSAEKLEISIEWSGLLHGALVGEVDVDRPRLAFVLAATEASSQTGIEDGWLDVLADLVPFKINTCTISDGTLTYADETRSPGIDLVMTDLHLIVTNLTNIRDPESEGDGAADRLVATIEASGAPLGDGRFWGQARLDPFAESPTFDLDAILRNVDLRALNEFTLAYAGFDAERGRFHVTAEFACADGRIVGYVAPLFEDVEIAESSEIESVGDVFTFLWESVVGTAAEALENQSVGRVATRIPLEGRIEGPSPDVFATIGNLLVNAFIRALGAGLEGSVSLEDALAERTESESREGDEASRRRKKAETTRGSEAAREEKDGG